MRWHLPHSSFFLLPLYNIVNSTLGGIWTEMHEKNRLIEQEDKCTHATSNTDQGSKTLRWVYLLITSASQCMSVLNMLFVKQYRSIQNTETDNTIQSECYMNCSVIKVFCGYSKCKTSFFYLPLSSKKKSWR